MRITLVFPFYTDTIHHLNDVLDAYPIVRCLPPAIAALGHTVNVFLQSPINHSTETEVSYQSIAAGPLARTTARVVHRWKPHLGPAYYEPIRGIVRAIERCKPDIVHFFGLTMDIQLAQIARMCRRRAIPLVVHFHGGEPATGRRRALQRHNLARVDCTLFTTSEQAAVWIAAGVIASPSRVGTVLETSSPLQRIERTRARRRTGMSGHPVCVSVGRLHAIKDPMTMLRGFAQFHAAVPTARLYLYYLTAELLDEMQAFVDAAPTLRLSVEFRGRAPASEMAAIFSSADFLLQASRREWSGLAILEAMSCGCIPIISDIPSFRGMTDGGRFGSLFRPGSADDLAVQLKQAWESMNVLGQRSEAVAAHFQERLSFDTIARRLDSIYRELQVNRTSHASTEYNALL